MQKKLRWYQHFGINSYFFGQSLPSAILGPLLMPYLVYQFMPKAYTNTYLATLSVIGLAVAMFVQPVAGLMSDRSTSRFGRRRPYIAAGALLNIVFLGIIAVSPSFKNSPLDPMFQTSLGITTAFAVLLLGQILQQVSANIAQAASQGLMPDVTPPEQRGFSSGTKSVFELLPSVIAIVVGPMVSRGQVWLTVGILMAGFLITMITTLISAQEVPQTEQPAGSIREPVLRFLALTVIFVVVAQSATWLVRYSGEVVKAMQINTQVLLVGLAGLAAMAGAIFIGVYLGAWVGIGKEAPQQTSFIWWVINRLMFLAAIGSIRTFAQNYLRDVLKVPNPPTATSLLMAFVAGFLVISALAGGAVGDRIGRKKTIAIASAISAAGTFLLLLSNSMTMVYLSGCVIGIGAGTFMATNWALGTDMVPPKESGRYLGISNLAGAGAGIVGAGIGGPMADSFNLLVPGLGYTVVFAIYGGLFIISMLTLVKVKETRRAKAVAEAAPAAQPGD